MLSRTAKSCGPDAPTLASSLRSRVGPTGLRQDISAGDGGKQARSPGRARRKPLKPLRAGTPGDSGVLVVTRVLSTNTKCTRGRGCNGHPAFPTPSLGGRFIIASGASRREDEVAWGIIAMTVLHLNCPGCLKMNLGSVRNAGLRSRHKAHPSCPDLIRASINLRKTIFEEDGLPGIGERKRRRPSDGYARQ